MTKLHGNACENTPNALLEEAQLLRDSVRPHSTLFSLAFVAGTLNVPPVELTFNEKIESVRPIVAKDRPLSYEELRVVQDWIRSSLAVGIIEPSNRTWKSSVSCSEATQDIEGGYAAGAMAIGHAILSVEPAPLHQRCSSPQHPRYASGSGGE